jgi:hypothetical protein
MTFPVSSVSAGSLDGAGAGDHDLPYRFGGRPRTETPYPFSTRQYARLLIMRSRVHAGDGGLTDDMQPASNEATAN